MSIVYVSSGSAPVSQVVVTKPGKLSCKQIIHVVYDFALSDLQECINNCLVQAEMNAHKSISFPAIGTGLMNEWIFMYIETVYVYTQPYLGLYFSI